MAFETTSASGVPQYYGPRLSETTDPLGISAKESTFGNRTELEVRFNLVGPLPGILGNLAKVIPAGSVLEDAKLYVEEAATGTSGVLQVGLLNTDGTTNDADGIFSSVAQASLTAGAWIQGAGALLPQASVTNDGAGTDPVVVALSSTGAKDSVIVASVASGTFTGGRVRIVLTYLRAQG